MMQPECGLQEVEPDGVLRQQLALLALSKRAHRSKHNGTTEISATRLFGARDVWPSCVLASHRAARFGTDA
jgi:hypothetical protein